MTIGRWAEKCIAHYDNSVFEFFEEYFQDTSRSCLVVSGAGFDPRSVTTIKCLSSILNDRLRVIAVRENRPSPDARLVKEAESNLHVIENCCSSLEVESIDIFANDGAVIGGHEIIKAISNIDLSPFTDVLVDMSALSMGISYPIVSFMYQTARKEGSKLNVHVSLQTNPDLDEAIISEPNDFSCDVRGFSRQELYGEEKKALLWLPILSENKQQISRIIQSTIRPQDICPILPFPTEDPKKGDRVASAIFSSIRPEWGVLENEWGLEPQNFLFADERKPLDIYRTILRLHDERTPVFQAIGGSTIVLSPLGSKIPTVGALMAALERDFPVVYVETLSYNVDWEKVSEAKGDQARMAHIWLHGDAYFDQS